MAHIATLPTPSKDELDLVLKNATKTRARRQSLEKRGNPLQRISPLPD